MRGGAAASGTPEECAVIQPSERRAPSGSRQSRKCQVQSSPPSPLPRTLGSRASHRANRSEVAPPTGSLACAPATVSSWRGPCPADSSHSGRPAREVPMSRRRKSPGRAATVARAPRSSSSRVGYGVPRMPGSGQVPFALLAPVVSFLSSGRITILAAMWSPLLHNRLCATAEPGPCRAVERVRRAGQPPLPPLLSPVVSFLSKGRITILVGTPTPPPRKDVAYRGAIADRVLSRLDSGHQSVKACTCNGKGSW